MNPGHQPFPNPVPAAKRGRVQRLLILFASLALMISLGFGSVAHAAESAMPIEAAAAIEAGHSAGDADEVPADADKGVPHHHGTCHGHDIGVPLDPCSVSVATAIVQPGQPRTTTLLAITADTALRPPRA